MRTADFKQISRNKKGNARLRGIDIPMRKMIS